MKTLTVRQFAGVKRIAQNVNPLVVKKNKIAAKIDELNAEYNALTEEIEGHEMHTEYISVSRHTIQRLIAHQGKAIAVGTTSVRTLESLYYMGVKLHADPTLTEDQLHVGQWEPYDYARSVAEGNDCQLPVTDALQAILDMLDRDERQALHSSTQIIIAPGYEYKIVDTLVTNFHQPQSTLLLLVSAFVHGDWRRIYDYALAHDFRFLSYGDSCLIKY